MTIDKEVRNYEPFVYVHHETQKTSKFFFSKTVVKFDSLYQYLYFRR